MCGIVGYVGSRPCCKVLLDGLRRLEYRGYDSAGIAWREGEFTSCIRTVGNLASLEAAVVYGSEAVRGTAVAPAEIGAGIGHTRWATHGGVSDSCKEVGEHAEEVIYIPSVDPLLQVVLSVIPLQLFAYHVARTRGLNVDQPRNLAKTVTVE